MDTLTLTDLLPLSNQYRLTLTTTAQWLSRASTNASITYSLNQQMGHLAKIVNVQASISSDTVMVDFVPIYSDTIDDWFEIFKVYLASIGFPVFNIISIQPMGSVAINANPVYLGPPVSQPTSTPTTQGPPPIKQPPQAPSTGSTPPTNAPMNLNTKIMGAPLWVWAAGGLLVLAGVMRRR